MSRLPLLLFCSRSTTSTSLHLATTSKLSAFYWKRLSSTLSSPQLINQSPVTFTSTSKIMRRFIRKASSALSSSPPKEKPENGLDSSESYQAAIRTLNTLQSNAATIALIRSNPHLRRSTSLPQTTSALLLSGIPLESLSTLPIIHVAGTKGKGMTCAFTESILRQAGLKTGFFSSPHLTYVRERIRINGQPISEEIFAKKFFQVYNRLKHLQDNPSSTTEMPPYFRFLTILAFHIFLEEACDVIILEVGIGGRYDSTNIIPAPSVVGITALGLEHQQILGHTLEEIALNKAGIMKPNCPAFTISTHPPSILALLRAHAQQVPCPLEIIDPLDLSSLPLGVYDGPSGVAQQNATLAIHLANQLLLQRHSHIFPKLSMDTTSSLNLPYSQSPENFLPFQTRGLELCQWPGRFQRVEDPDPQNRKKIVWYLDGAHTPESLKCTLDWFNLHTSSSRSLRLLIFNLTGNRSPEVLMNPLVTSNIFDLAIFCPFGSSPDNWSALENSEEMEDPLESCRKLAKIWENLQTRSKGVCLANAEETMDYVRELCTGENFRVQVLVTGSLHLVGTFLYVLQPELVQNE